MTIVYSAAIKNTFAAAILAAIDAGSGAGRIQLRAGTTVIGNVPFADPAGTVSGGILTLDVDPVPEANAIAAGTIDNCQVQDSTGAIVFSGTVTVTGGGGDVTMGNTTVAINDPLRLNSLVYTAP